MLHITTLDLGMDLAVLLMEYATVISINAGAH